MIPEGNGAVLISLHISAWKRTKAERENCKTDRDGHRGKEEEQVNENLGFSCHQHPEFSPPSPPFPPRPPSWTVHFGALAE